MPFHFEEIPSTQTYLKEYVQSHPVNHLEYVLADQQTGGMGRQGRTWISDKGNLFFSLYIKHHAIPLTWVPHWMAVNLAQTLVSLGVPGASMKLKWPNDLILNGYRKAAGILCEKVGDGIIAGIGVNLISSPELSDRATGSIQSVAPGLSFEGFAPKLAAALIERLAREPALADLRRDYSALSLFQAGQALEWMDLQTQAEGSAKFVRYGDFGELIVNEEGRERPLYSEEVKLGQ